MRRFELDANSYAEQMEDGGVFVAQTDDCECVTITQDGARALCAALIESGFGPEVGVCKWERNPPNQYNDDWTLRVGCTQGVEDESNEFCPYCGKRIEVVR